MTPLQAEARRVTDWALDPMRGLRPRPGDRLWLGATGLHVWALASQPEAPGAKWIGVPWPSGCVDTAYVGPRAAMALELAIASALEAAQEVRT